MRSSMYFTGRPPDLRDSSAAMSVPRGPPLPPNPPPIGWGMTLTLLVGRLSARARAMAQKRGVW